MKTHYSRKTLNLLFNTILWLYLLLSGLLVQSTQTAPNATLTVTTATDELLSPGPDCSLREAITDTNNDTNTYSEFGDRIPTLLHSTPKLYHPTPKSAVRRFFVAARSYILYTWGASSRQHKKECHYVYLDHK